MRASGYYWVRYQIERFGIERGALAVARWDADYRCDSVHGAWQLMGCAEHWTDHVCEVVSTRLHEPSFDVPSPLPVGSPP